MSNTTSAKPRKRKPCPAAIWCIVSATSRVDACSGKALARLTAAHWDDLYPESAPHRVCRYALAVSK